MTSKHMIGMSRIYICDATTARKSYKTLIESMTHITSKHMPDKRG